MDIKAAISAGYLAAQVNVLTTVVAEIQSDLDGGLILDTATGVMQDKNGGTRPVSIPVLTLDETKVLLGSLRDIFQARLDAAAKNLALI